MQFTMQERVCTPQLSVFGCHPLYLCAKSFSFTINSKKMFFFHVHVLFSMFAHIFFLNFLRYKVIRSRIQRQQSVFTFQQITMMLFTSAPLQFSHCNKKTSKRMKKKKIQTNPGVSCEMCNERKHEQNRVGKRTSECRKKW